MSGVALVVIAKAPSPGRSKTRLCPPCTPAQAATLAEAALGDTLAAVAATPARRRILALDGEPGGWLPPGFEVLSQRGDGLGARLGHALGAAGGPALVVGMDTPQLGPTLLSFAAARLGEPGVDAVLGPAVDGGYWTIGLRRPDPAVFDGVPMSSASTCAVQRRRLDALRRRTAMLPALRDVDTIEDAELVARACPGSRFAAVFAELRRELVPPRAGRGRNHRRYAAPGPTRRGPSIAGAG
jgi:rSAM/selenodomain-associated transferase 1